MGSQQCLSWEPISSGQVWSGGRGRVPEPQKVPFVHTPTRRSISTGKQLAKLPHSLDGWHMFAYGHFGGSLPSSQESHSVLPSVSLPPSLLSFLISFHPSFVPFLPSFPLTLLTTHRFPFSSSLPRPGFSFSQPLPPFSPS